MAIKATCAALPPLPDPPSPELAVTPTEAWYLQCLRLLAEHYGRSPTTAELARYTGKSRTAVRAAMISLVEKAVLTDDGPGRYRIAVAA